MQAAIRIRHPSITVQITKLVMATVANYSLDTMLQGPVAQSQVLTREIKGSEDF